MASGGKRPGSGRKKGFDALKAEQYRKLLEVTVSEHAKELAEALVNKALTGDVPALKEINERALGKVKDELDLTSKGEQITGFNYIKPNDTDNSANEEARPGVDDSA